VAGPRRRSGVGAGSTTGRQRIVLRIAGLVLVGMAGAALAPRGVISIGPAKAQQAEPVTIKVAPILRGEAPASLPIKIQISPAQGAKNAFIRIRGLPRTVALSEGHAIAPGSWSVPLAALATLTFILPAGLEGQSEVSISFVSVDGGVLAEAKTTLVVAAAKDRPPAETRAISPPAAAPAPIVPKMDPAERERAMRLHVQGVEQLQRGNVYAARKFFELAATAGLAQSAIAAAATYDPDELGKLNVVGLQPDAAAARKWYEKARELGAVEAAERLRRLGSR
jgi:hypothetical protein